MLKWIVLAFVGVSVIFTLEESKRIDIDREEPKKKQR